MTEQRIMTINMRKAMEAVPRYKKASAAVKFLSGFVKRHMKAQRVKVDLLVNNSMFERGIKNPPIKMRVICTKDDKNVVTVSLIKKEREEKK
jgi:large subunit ribosomal protein L31e